MKKTIFRISILPLLVTSVVSCGERGEEPLRDIAYDAFVYAYPMIEQVKTVNGMIEFIGMTFNKVAMNSTLPWENVGQPIVAPNLTSMTGGVLLDLSNGPVTLEIPEVKDRYIVYQCIDGFTHNFFYMGSRANGGEGGRFTFYNRGQTLPDIDATPVEVETDHAVIVVRIDIKGESEADRVRGIQNAIRLVDVQESDRSYPTFDEEKQFSPGFVDYLNELLTEDPVSETELFERFARIGVFSDVELTEEERREVQAGVDSAFNDIVEQGRVASAVGNGWLGATELFGTREFFENNYMYRAIGAHFGLWGNSKEEANYFLGNVEGEGEIVFRQDELPPLTDIGFWSITVHDENVLVHPNPYDSYVITQDQMQFEEDGSIVFKFSSQPEEGNWLYTPGGKMVILIRAYQADPERIATYVPPEFKLHS